MDRPTRRLILSGVAAVTVVTTVVALPSSGESGREGDFRTQAEAARPVAARDTAPLAPDGHAHDHSDPATRNAISRGGVSQGAVDPTTAEEAAASADYVEESRGSEDPELAMAPLREPRNVVPQDRYEMAGGCYTLADTATTFQATDLGRYLLFGPDETFLTAETDGTTSRQPAPSPDADWITEQVAEGFTFRLDDGRYLRQTAEGLRTGATPTPFALELTDGCAAYPEVEVNVDGLPHAGVTPFQEVRGYVDAHTHGMAFEFLGGDAHCGRPWHRYGAPSALVDCPDHSMTGGFGGVLESFLSGEPHHDPVGWPAFKDWPAPHSLTHEGTYHTWMERSWRGGLRLFVNLLVENGQLCQHYPIKHNSCDEMDSIRLQAQRMEEFERYVDAQAGGPGEGWYRIVESPWEAREVINQGKLAVIMGIETSLPFGCTFKRVPLQGDVPACDEKGIERQLDEVWNLGVRQMELTNKFDNALTGVAGDAGAIGPPVNYANFRETNTFWDMRHCEPPSDKSQFAAPSISPEQQDALFGAVAELSAAASLPATPLYGPAPHCNARGLTDLGEFLVREMAERHMLIDPDHMSVKARDRLLDIVADPDLRYPGVLSSHSWSTDDAYPRIYELGGFVAPYAGDSTSFFGEWQQHTGWADERYYFGFGFGADINGLGAQGNPRNPDEGDDVDYPITGLGGVTIDRQVSGQRQYDINVDGVAHYGLYPDWIEDLRMIGGEADGAAIVEDLSRGAEAYLQTWERAEGIRADSCRNPELRLDLGTFRQRVRTGMTTLEVMEAVGQPFTRLGSTYGLCARTASGNEVRMDIAFDDGGRVVGVRRAG